MDRYNKYQTKQLLDPAPLNHFVNIVRYMNLKIDWLIDWSIDRSIDWLISKINYFRIIE